MRPIIAALLVTFLLGCSSTPEHPPLPRPESVELQRFMGDWHVIGFIPLPPEEDAYNAVESYRLREDGKIATTYRFREGDFAAPLETYTPVASVVEGSDNTHWKMQFIWPFKADYRIAYLAEDYSVTIIARQARDYVWLLAREPQLPAAQRRRLEQRIVAMGYSLEHFKYAPQRWPEAQAREPLPR